MPRAYIGVDVGTTSTRAGVFDEAGKLLATAKHPIRIWHEAGDIVEQSSEDIWDACVTSVRAAMAEAAIAPDSVNGIGFDATCSLVVLDREGQPLTVSASGDKQRNVIVWMDHRAIGRGAADQRHRGRRAALCRRLDLAGDGDAEAVVAEAASARELRCRRAFFRSRRLSDLARDRLAARSICTVTCKWNYLAHEAALERAVLQTHRAAGLRRRALRPHRHRHRRARHAAWRRSRPQSRRRSSACRRARRSAPP